MPDSSPAVSSQSIEQVRILERNFDLGQVRSIYRHLRLLAKRFSAKSHT